MMYIDVQGDNLERRNRAMVDGKSAYLNGAKIEDNPFDEIIQAIYWREGWHELHQSDLKNELYRLRESKETLISWMIAIATVGIIFVSCKIFM